MTGVAVVCQGLVHIYRARNLEVVALQGLNLEVAPGEVVAVVGRSGSGKTTLMNILAGVEPPTAGSVVVMGRDLNALDERGREDYRRHVVGYVVQRGRNNLAPALDVRSNVMVSLQDEPGRERERRADSLLDAFGLERLGRLRPAELSGGEAQRAAIAAALVARPRLLLADEPTAELDRASANLLLADLRRELNSNRTTAVLVTHDSDVERHADRVIQIRDGRTSTEHRWVAQEKYELVIIDREGRLQVPEAYVERLKLRGRVRMEVEGDRLVITPAEELTMPRPDRPRC